MENKNRLIKVMIRQLRFYQIIKKTLILTIMELKFQNCLKQKLKVFIKV